MTSPALDGDDLYDFILLANVRSPGLVTLSGHDRKHKIDVKEGDGQSGASTTYKGEQIAQFTASFDLTADPADAEGEDDFTQWTIFRTIIDSTVSGPAPVAVDIYHPDLASNGITSVILAGMGPMVHDGKGGATVVVSFSEYKPPKPKSGSPKGSKGWVNAKKDKDPIAKLEAQLDDLLGTGKAAP